MENIVEHILFYGKSRPYFCFSNWYPARFKCKDGKIWPTSEHYYMSKKTNDPDHKEAIRTANTPKKAKELAGPEGIITLVENWEEIKFDVMCEAIYLKFSQNDYIRLELISTRDASLHEDCPDKVWGGGPNYPDGQDLLGKALMVVRARLIDDVEEKSAGLI